MQVEVTQFILPDGRQKTIHCDVSDELESQYKLMQDSGCRLTAEVLRTGDVSICIEHPELGDAAMEINFRNSGETNEALTEKLLRGFSPDLVEEMR